MLGVGYPEQEETLSGTCQEHVRNMSGTLYRLMSRVGCGIFGTRRNVRNMSGACQERVRNGIPINVTCRAWDINVGHYISATLSTSFGPITIPGASVGGLVGDNRSICLGLVEIVIVCSQCVI